ncbi:hypothetical protein ACIA98_17315 [Streptomyces sp. NPDC051366]|uniref:hypothetical protein n=1 Tax=Streptomyces sp. NPDC051366 TaxID=3365652 RepID=UPI0037AB75DC
MITNDETAPVIVRLSAVVEAPLSTVWDGLDITSTVHELVPGKRIVWGGPAGGITGIHVWTFEQNGDRTSVRTEESWSDAPVEAAADDLGKALQDSLDNWLSHRKARAEHAS